jgi:hypothetical protein
MRSLGLDVSWGGLDKVREENTPGDGQNPNARNHRAATALHLLLLA